MISTSAALRRPFIFDALADPQVYSPFRSTSGEQAEPQGSPLTRFPAKINPSARIFPSGVVPASRLAIRPAPAMASTGILDMDALTGGFPRGCLTEICGPASSGRTTVLLSALAAATRRGEFCALIDSGDAFDPHSAAAAGTDLERLLWVRCGEDAPRKPRDPENTGNEKPGGSFLSAHSSAKARVSQPAAIHFDKTNSRQSEHRLEQVLRSTDLLLESGGFGLIVLDLADLPPQSARRIPLTTWFRFRRAVENKPTILLAIEQHPIAGNCSSLLLQLGTSDPMPPADESLEQPENAARGANREPVAGKDEVPYERKKICAGQPPSIDFQFVRPAHAHLLTGLKITTELVRSRLERKPTRSTAAFSSKTAWAG